MLLSAQARNQTEIIVPLLHPDRPAEAPKKQRGSSRFDAEKGVIHRIKVRRLPTCRDSDKSRLRGFGLATVFSRTGCAVTC